MNSAVSPRLRSGALHKQVLERFARLFERQVRMHQFADSINALVASTHDEILDVLQTSIRDIEALPLGPRERDWINAVLDRTRTHCHRLERALELLLGERERVWIANGDDLRHVMLETNRTAQELASTLIDKSLLERYTQIIENIVLSHEKVTHWRHHIQQILAEFQPLMPVSLFFIAMVERGHLTLYVYYMQNCSTASRTRAQTTLAAELAAQLGFGPDLDWSIEEFYIGERELRDGDDVAAQLITAPVPSLDAADFSGVLGTSVASVGCLGSQEASIIRSALAVLVMVVASSKALNRTLSELEYYSSHDPLTGLHNRRYFNEILKYEIDRSARHHHEFSLVMLDLDDFKEINDTYGHPCGDTVLLGVADIMRSCVRKGDFVTRIGGDEFAILLTETGIGGAQLVAEKIRRRIRATEFRNGTDGALFHITTSIGLVCYPHHARSLDDLLAGVDAGLYRAKARGKDGIIALDAVQDVLESNRSSRAYVERLRSSLKNGRVVPFFQPIVDCNSGATLGFECLARMREPDGEITSAGMFVSAMEKYGLGRELDRLMIQQSLRALRQRNADDASPLKLFINLSAREIHGRGVLGYAERICRDLEISPHTVVFEIMERDAIEDMTRMRKFLSSLRGKGFQFALDDFGSGYNSFHYLRELEFDYIKIDGAFVKNILKSKIDYALVRNLSRLCQEIGARTIAEFVESDQLMAHIRDIGIDYAQGYHLGRPAPRMTATG